MNVLVENLGKIWSEESSEQLAALTGINHTFGAQKFSCLLGPSGCGKSTLIKIVGGLETATEGRVLIASVDHDQPLPLGSQSVMMWQGLNLFPWRTVLDNVAFGLEMAGVERSTRIDQAMTWLAAVGLSAFKDHRPNQLSGGMRQRVALARALILERPILLMDEPFGALDAQTKIVMQEELIRIFERSRKTVLFVTHAIDEAILLGDEVVVMTARPGRIKETIPIDLPRPRSIEMVNTKRFGELFDYAFHLIREEVTASMQQQAAGAA